MGTFASRDKRKDIANEVSFTPVLKTEVISYTMISLRGRAAFLFVDNFLTDTEEIKLLTP